MTRDLGDDARPQPPGVQYFADAGPSGIEHAISEIAAHTGEIPMFVGAGVSIQQVTSHSLWLGSYALAGGGILHLIGEIRHGVRRIGPRELGIPLLAPGFTAGVVTELVVTDGGG